MQNGEGVLNAMAARLVRSRANLDDALLCAVALVRDGFSIGDIVGDLPEIIRRARSMGARNQITEIAATVASFQPREGRSNGF